MATIDVTFKRDLSAGAALQVTLGEGDSSTIIPFDDDGAAAVTLNARTVFPAFIEIIGKNGDKVTVSWEMGGVTGVLIDHFKIDRDSRLTGRWPGGKWRSVAVTSFRTRG